MLISYILVLFILILFAFFSLSETALTASSKAELLRKADQGNKRAILTKNLLSKPDKLITSLLISATLTSSLFVILVNNLVLKFFNVHNLLLESLIVTTILLIFGEILPKTFAFYKPTQSALFLSPIIYIISWLLTPISLFFLSINKFILKYILRQKPSDENKLFATVENLRGAIEMLDREDSKQIVSEERAMLHSVLDLTDITVSDILNHRKNVFCINLDDEKEDIVKQILYTDYKYTRIPLYKGSFNNIVGILNTKEFFKEYNTKSNDINIENLIHTPYFIPETTYVIDLLMKFKSTKERMALVVDEYGTFMGILTLGDIIEEIMGEIENSEDNELSNEIEKLDENTYVINGDLKIRDLNRKMEWKLPDENFTTLSGLILYETAEIPNEGDCFTFHGCNFEILQKHNQRIIKIKVKLLN